MKLQREKQIHVVLLLLPKLQKLWPQHVTKCSVKKGKVSLANVHRVYFNTLKALDSLKLSFRFSGTFQRCNNQPIWTGPNPTASATPTEIGQEVPKCQFLLHFNTKICPQEELRSQYHIIQPMLSHISEVCLCGLVFTLYVMTKVSPLTY